MKFLKIVSFMVYLSIILFSFLLYSKISSVLPVIRGLSIEKNLFWATRIQFINLLSFFAILILGNSILRYEDFKKSKVVVVSLILTIVLKGIIEFTALFYDVLLINSVFILIPVIVIGLLIVLYHSQYIFNGKRWKNIKFTISEIILLSIIGIVYILINIPSLIYIISNK